MKKKARVLLVAPTLMRNGISLATVKINNDIYIPNDKQIRSIL